MAAGKRSDQIRRWLDEHGADVEMPAGVSLTFDFGEGGGMTVRYTRVDRPERSTVARLVKMD